MFDIVSDSSVGLVYFIQHRGILVYTHSLAREKWGDVKSTKTSESRVVDIIHILDKYIREHKQYTL